MGDIGVVGGRKGNEEVDMIWYIYIYDIYDMIYKQKKKKKNNKPIIPQFSLIS